MKSVLALLAASLAVPAAAQSLPPPEDIRVLTGRCLSLSTVSRGPEGADISGPEFQTPYTCNGATVSYHARRGTVMITFATRGGYGSNLISFAGRLRDRSTLEVERIYLEDVQQRVTEGRCDLFYVGTNVAEIACGARIEGSPRTVAIVGFRIN